MKRVKLKNSKRAFVKAFNIISERDGYPDRAKKVTGIYEGEWLYRIASEYVNVLNTYGPKQEI